MANQPIKGDQEIDLAQVSQKFRNAVSRTNDKVFDGILFLKRNIIIIAVILLAGIALGWYMDRKKVYTTKMFVIPNFGSVDYLYAKVDLLNSKIGELDADFYNEIGLGSNIAQVKIEPVVDIYKFIEGDKENNRNYDIFRLMTEGSDVSKVMQDEPTGKHYKTHVITILTGGKTTHKECVEPILKYLNNSPYFEVIKKEGIQNLERKIAATDTTLKQIDGILNDVAKSKPGTGTTVNYSEDGSLDDVIKLKNELTNKQGDNRIALINAKSLIQDSGVVLNEKNTKGLRGKNKFVLPILFLSIFLIIAAFLKYYKGQMQKRAAAAA